MGFEPLALRVVDARLCAASDAVRCMKRFVAGMRSRACDTLVTNVGAIDNGFARVQLPTQHTTGNQAGVQAGMRCSVQASVTSAAREVSNVRAADTVQRAHGWSQRCTWGLPSAPVASEKRSVSRAARRSSGSIVRQYVVLSIQGSPQQPQP